MTKKVKLTNDFSKGNTSELIVITKQHTSLRASAGRFESLVGEDTKSIESILKDHKSQMQPIFGSTEERILESLNMMAEETQAPMEDLSVFYSIDVAPDKMESLKDELEKSAFFEAAYIKPPAEPPVESIESVPLPEEPPSATPDYTSRQIYLNSAPQGIDARWAWTQAGGRGQNIRIIDIEGNWRFTHEDLTQMQGGIVAGTPHSGRAWRDHGTAVLGEYSGDRNSYGVKGICPDAIASAVSHGGVGSARAIQLAAARLRAGDILLLEMHRPGPRHEFRRRDDQKGYIAVEWWPDDFAAILAASQRGIIVVEAAGNGAENLDDILYETAASGFPAGWTNPFRRSNRDSGAIVVGAGAPPPGTHGRNHGPDRSRLAFSNYGALVDAQGWGREVTTCGYGDLQGGSNEDLWYTDTFSGTSSASPIVVGAIGCIQGMAKARGRAVLTPVQVRNCLRRTGSAQQDASGRSRTQRIGNRPDLRAFAACAFPVKIKEVKEVKESKEIKENDKLRYKDLKDRIKEHKERKEFKEFKEKDKDIYEGKRFDKLREIGPQQPEENDLGSRLDQLEQTVGELVHFIGSELRPDLSQSALQGDPDLTQCSQNAKEEKDLKDTEKPPENQ